MKPQDSQRPAAKAQPDLAALAHALEANIAALEASGENLAACHVQLAHDIIVAKQLSQ